MWRVKGFSIEQNIDSISKSLFGSLRKAISCYVHVYISQNFQVPLRKLKVAILIWCLGFLLLENPANFNPLPSP